MSLPSRTPPWRFLVMGCGSIGKRHIGNLLSAGGGEVLAYDVRADRADEVRARFEVEVLTDLEAAFARDPNVAFVTAPTSLHVPLARQAAERGCHLFVEKPLSHSQEGIEPLLASVRHNKLVTLVGCNLRFHPGLLAIKKLLAEGTIGRVVAARVEVGQYLPDWHPYEDYRQGYSARRDLGGGVILDAIHELDYIQWLLGPVVATACFAGKLSHLEIQTEDTAAIMLRFASGAIGEVHLDYVQRAPSRTCQLIGDEGTLRWDYAGGEVRHYAAKSGTWRTAANAAGWEPNQMYKDELTHFLRCLAGIEESTLDVFAAARILEVALAAKQSADTNQVLSLRERG